MMQLDHLKASLFSHHMHACLISRGSDRLFTYYGDNKQGKLEQLNSISKSILALAAGKAIELNLLRPDTRIGSVFPTAGDRISHIRLKDLLVMRSGFTEADWVKVIAEESWSTALLHKNSLKTGVHYTNAASYLISLLLTKVLSADWTKLLEEEIFYPLDITDYKWDRSPEGIIIGGYGLQMKAEDLIKINHLILNEGKFQNKQLISNDYLQNMLTPWEKNIVRGQSYGYHWWMAPNVPTVYYAAGSSGKFSFLVPEKNIAAVFLGDLEKNELIPFRWFIKYVLS